MFLKFKESNKLFEKNYSNKFSELEKRVRDIEVSYLENDKINILRNFDQQILDFDDVRRVLIEYLKMYGLKPYNEDFLFEIINLYIQNHQISIQQLTNDDFNKLKEQISLFTLKEIHKLAFEDVTAKPDFALGAVGAKIIDFTGKWAFQNIIDNSLSFLGQNSEKINSPTVILDSFNEPGRCWSFHGSNAFVTIQLSTTIYIESFTLDHIAASITHDSNVSSATKNFRVLVNYFLSFCVFLLTLKF